MTEILYLASGAGRRFGSNKLLYPLEGKPLYRHGLDTLIRVARRRGDCRVTVVSRYPQIRREAEALGVRTADSPESEKGLSHTIRAGIASLGELGPEDFLVFAVADQPWLGEASLEKLLDLAVPGTECACLSREGRGGNPALFRAALAPELLALEGDTGGRALLRRHPCIHIPAEERELQDVDTAPEI